MLTTKGIIFDLDGVITDTAEFHYKAWKQLGEEIDITITKEFNERLKGISRLDSLEMILQLSTKNSAYTMEEKHDLLKRKNNHYLSLINNMTTDSILPGVLSFLKEIKQANLKIGLASASKNAPFILDKLEIQEYFDTIVNPAELKNGKPDPEIFLKAAAELNIEATLCVGIEDAAAGITAINKANMYSIGIGDSNILSHAKYVVDNLTQLSLKDLP
ncbi:beta-phosphoglucomutase [Bacillus cereus BAG6X1-2]|nr:beta-phosphoglucomutase [Bacillus cereus BAG6X1-2]